MKILRLRVEVRPVAGDHSPAEGWKITYHAVLPDGSEVAPLPQDWPQSRSLGVQAAGNYMFPSLPPNESPSELANLSPGMAQRLTDYCTGSDPAGLEKLYRQIVRRSPEAEDVETFGRYLFEILIGQPAWKAICSWANLQAADILEVALAWGPAEIDLHRLNWEMMHGPETFLAARQLTAPHKVVITRMVMGARHAPVPIQEVPRYLFIIGAPATDPGIRPGTEFLGLLLGVKEQKRFIYPQVLHGAENQGANPIEIVTALKRFNPHAVHFTCHGKFDNAGGAALTLQPDPSDPQKKDFDTEAIFALLSKTATLPQLVVLSACNTGQAEAVSAVAQPASMGIKGGFETAPMAAGLVSRGIPVVIGMAGQVADSACRHFTRRFGEAIVACEPLVSAAAEGRWAAFAYGQAVETSVDWAFPALFLSEAVPPGFTPLQEGEDTQYALVESWIKDYNLRRQMNEPRIFCGRQQFFDAFYRLFELSSPSVLAVYVKEGSGFGKSRLLEELAMVAIREGHVPLPLIHTQGNATYPINLETLRKALIIKLNRVSEIYASTSQNTSRPQLARWKLVDLKPGANGSIDWHVDNLTPGLQRELESNDGQLTGNALALGLREDLMALARFVREVQPYVGERKGRPVLFLDDVHLFGEEFISSWFSGDVLAGYGLGKDHDTLIPVVMSLSLSGEGGQAANQIIDPMIQKKRSLNWLNLMPLETFPNDHDQDLLLYQEIWLNPFQPSLYPGASDLPITWASAPDQRPGWNDWLFLLRRQGRYPLLLTMPDFYAVTSMGLGQGMLLPANDQKRLENYMKGKDAGG